MTDKLLIENRPFTSLDGQRSFEIPYIVSPSVELVEEMQFPTLKEDSASELAKHYKSLSKSSLNHGGAAIIFGTYDNLHIGHEIMLKTAAAVCDDLYIGLESQEAALTRKKNKHPILDDADRLKMLEEMGVTSPEKSFVRKNALQDIIALEQAGKPISTLLVGETQRDNEEIIAAVDYCLKKGISVVAITRAKPSNVNRPISSSALHQAGIAKISKAYTP